jgi:hypothetical protein
VALHSGGNTFTQNQYVTNGIVGIGTTAPGRLLQIGHGNNPVDAMIRLGCGTGTGIGRTWDIGVPYGGSNTGGTNYSFTITDLGVNTARFMIDWNTGDVCIGTTTPLGMLTVSNAYCNGTTWQSGSDRNIKEDFAPVDAAQVLARVVSLPVQSWSYKAQPGDKHIGPVAQDFHAAFGLNGTDDKHIATVDEGGVALAAIQGLNQKIESGKQKAEILEQRLQHKETEITELKQTVNELTKLMEAMNHKLNGGAKQNEE